MRYWDENTKKWTDIDHIIIRATSDVDKLAYSTSYAYRMPIRNAVDIELDNPGELFMLIDRLEELKRHMMGKDRTIGVLGYDPGVFDNMPHTCGNCRHWSQPVQDVPVGCCHAHNTHNITSRSDNTCANVLTEDHFVPKI